MRKIIFVNGEYYHIYNRGVDKRDIFFDDADYFRFLGNVKESRLELDCFKDRSPFVDVVCYCLMPNHFHLVVRQLKNCGISRFMHRLGIAYTAYFNYKYRRTGVLFQGAFKVKRVENDSYALHLSRYIHLNPKEFIDDREPGYRERMEKYKWSSLQFYLDDSRPSKFDLSKRVVLSHFRDLAEYGDFVFRKGPSLLDSYLMIDL